MKTLYLLRHAKSGWDDEQQRDFDRTLNARGRSAATAMGDYFRTKKIKPDYVLVSPAVRTMQTLDMLEASRGEPLHAHVQDDIYMANVQTLLGIVRAAPQDAQSLLLIGHNPALEDLAYLLVNDGDAALRTRLETKFPTATLCGFEMDIARWEDVAAKCGRLFCFIRPQDIGLTPDDD